MGPGNGLLLPVMKGPAACRLVLLNDVIHPLHDVPQVRQMLAGVEATVAAAAPVAAATVGAVGGAAAAPGSSSSSNGVVGGTGSGNGGGDGSGNDGGRDSGSCNDSNSAVDVVICGDFNAAPDAASIQVAPALMSDAHPIAVPMSDTQTTAA